MGANAVQIQEVCYSGRLVQPFVQVLREIVRTTGAIPEDALDDRDLDDRIPITEAHELLRVAVDLTGDQYLGLRAAMATDFGFFGALEYAAGTAETWHGTAKTIVKLAPLLNETAQFRLDVVGDRAMLLLATSVPLSRVAGDFCTAALWRAIIRWRNHIPAGAELWFAHPAPSDLGFYRSVFPDVELVFDTSEYALAFHSSLLDLPNEHADPRLHEILMDYGRRRLAEIPKVENLSERVRRSIIETMPDGSVSAERVAAMLNVSRRTLTRQLSDEGSSFRALLEEIRQRFAKHYLESTHMSASDIAFSLGFSQSAAFVRAFRRWTGYSPGEYRRRLRR